MIPFPERRDEAAPRTRWSMAASLLAHALLLIALVLLPHETRAVAPVTEITLVDPADGAAAPAAPAEAPAAAAEAAAGAVASSDHEQRFQRDRARAPVAPDPQRDGALDDRLN